MVGEGKSLFILLLEVLHPRDILLRLLQGQLMVLGTMHTAVLPAIRLIPLLKHHHIMLTVCFGLTTMVTSIAGHGEVSNIVILSTQQRLQPDAE